MTRQVSQHPALVFAKGHGSGHQALQVFRTHGSVLGTKVSIFSAYDPPNRPPNRITPRRPRIVGLRGAKRQIIVGNPRLTDQIDPASLAALPRGSGVYIFQGEGTLPLYIGKSIDIRARVLSHLRTPQEASMLAQTRRIDFIETAGEIGALLLEAHLIKQQCPLFNVRLRRVRSLRSIRLHRSPAGLEPRITDQKAEDINPNDGHYGLFSSKHSAQEKLRELARTHALCLALLGLEKAGTRGCFGVQLRSCRGACIGRENRTEHDERLLSALTETQIHAWPYPDAVDLIETRGEWVQRHRIHNWRHLGTQCSRNQGARFGSQPEAFDLDSYKILVRPILLGTASIESAARGGQV